MPATIKDVARLANCSIKTVSRVINSEPYIADETRNRVLVAIRDSGYSPNLAARRLVQQKSYGICILVYPGFMQPASAILTRLLDLSYEENYDLMLQTYYPTFPRSRRKVAEFVSGRRFDGFITTPPCEADGFIGDLLDTYKIPMVQINPFDQSTGLNPKHNIVVSNDKLGSRLAVKHLVQLGHKRIACLRGPRNLRASYDRLEGFKAVLHESGLEIRSDYLQDSEFTFDGGYTATKILMTMAEPPTAIYTASDESAQGALFASQELGIQVPEQLSICGHDDVLSASRMWPGLTTIHQPGEDLLEHALRLLIDTLKKNRSGDKPELLEPRLIVRGTTAQHH